MVEPDPALLSVRTGTVAILTTQLVLTLSLVVLYHNGPTERARLGLHHLCDATLMSALKRRTSTKRALILMGRVHKLAAKFSTLPKYYGLPQLMWDAATPRHVVPFAIMRQLET
jgi:hypothetical protein